jgi:L-alanine-DL-glutamate epimerase-like enolase superfamily enzyme
LGTRPIRESNPPQFFDGGRVERVEVSSYTVPTDFPESDGTLQWDKTTIVIVELYGGGVRGLGYTYADTSVAALIRGVLTQVVEGCNAMDVPGARLNMIHAIRNLGRPGIASMAISAVDIALWDLKARILNLPLVRLLGAARDGVEVYGSGGFTSYSDEQLRTQFSQWASAGFSMAKMKIGRNPEDDPRRVRCAREAIGDRAALFVDANGAYSRKQALALAHRLKNQSDVSWFEEPVSSDDLEGLRLVRDRAPEGMDIAAGEYGYDPFYFRRMLDAGAVDVLQADATRCGGITGFLEADALCLARPIALSAHTAPSVHMHACCAAVSAKNLEYFHDHERIERMFFDGYVEPKNGELRPDLSRPGLGLELRRQDVERYAASRPA